MYSFRASQCHVTLFTNHTKLQNLRRLHKTSLKTYSQQNDEVTAEATLYVHWPYCERLCTFCDFNKYLSNNVDQLRMKNCLVRETETLIRISGVEKIRSIFFGGGTPSLANQSLLAAVVDTVRRCASMEKDSEITLECNPTSYATENLSEFKNAGINRISCGLQTLSDADLVLLGRNHTVKDSLTFLERAKMFFPGRVSVDLLFGRPQQSAENWKEEIRDVTSLCDNHVSLYQLTVEKGTRLFQQVQRGELKMSSSDTLATMYETAVDELDACELKQYEVANFAKKGAKSKHNMSYWDGTQYIGIGPGAHGRFVCKSLGHKDRCARVQVAEPNAWMKTVEKEGHATAQAVALSLRDVLQELLMTSLRTARGITDERWCKLSRGIKLAEIFGGFPAIQRHVDNGYIEWNEVCLKPTKKGLAVADSLTIDLLPALHVIK